MRFLYNSLILSVDTPDDVRDHLLDRFHSDHAHEGEDFYMHVRLVEGIPSERKKLYGATEIDCEDDDAREAEVREYFQGNCLF